jgi:nicotinate-nucleotide adenylyltransferase
LRGRRIALFGGTFDPIHAGHLAVARAAQKRFHLDKVFFIPSSRPPHKHFGELMPFAHRYAMVSLACAEHPQFVPSLAEAETRTAVRRVFYTVDTVRRFRREFNGQGDRLYYLLGADSFLDIANWDRYTTLLTLCDFVVANRPGFQIKMLYRSLAPELLAGPRDGEPTGGSPKPVSIALRHTMVHLLDAVSSDVSATDVRRRLKNGKSIRGLVPRGVEDYIKKQNLYHRG